MASYSDNFSTDTIGAFDEFGATDTFWDATNLCLRRNATTPAAILLRKTAAVDPTNGWTPEENQKVRMKYRTTATITGEYGIILKAKDENTYILGEIDSNAGDTAIQVESVIDGVTWTTQRPIDVSGLAAHNATADHWVEMEIDGDTIAIRWGKLDPASNPWTYDSGFVQLTGINMNFDHYAAGRVGIWFRPNSTQHRVDDFSLVDEDVPENPPPHASPPASYAIPVPYHENNYPPVDWRPLHEDNVFNVPLPVNPRVHPNSAAICASLRATTPGQNGGPQNLNVINANEFSVPLYFADGSDPLYTMTHGRLDPGDPLFVNPISNWEHHNDTCRIPEDAVPATGSDAHLAVIQPDGSLWEFWECQKNDVAHTIVCGAGTQFASVYQRSTGTGAQIPPITIDALGIAGLIWPEEMESGEIPHALAGLVKCVDRDTLGGWTYPATSTALGCADYTNQAVAGMRLFLNYTDQEIEELTVDEWQKPILKAMANYGIILVDTTNNRWGVRGFVAPQTFTSFGWDEPMIRYVREQIDNGANNIIRSGSSGEYVLSLYEGVDWNRLRVCDVAEGIKYP